MTFEEAMSKLAKIIPSRPNEEAVIGRAVAVLLSEGYHDFQFEPLESGGLTLRTGPLELTDQREDTPVGQLQRGTELLVLAAVMTQPG
jgi:hypothetical protein